VDVSGACARAATNDRRSWQRILWCTSWCGARFHSRTEGYRLLEGENISIQWRWAEGQYNRLSSQAAELVDRNVAVIVAFDLPAAFAAKAATKNSPIVFIAGADPVRVGLVESLNQPHGNLTGVSHLLNSLAPKQLELLRELVPGFSRVALLVTLTIGTRELIHLRYRRRLMPLDNIWRC